MSKKTFPLRVTRREAAFLAFCRKMRYGTIEKVGVADGQPAVVQGAIQRIDLMKDDEVAYLLGGKELPDDE